MRPEGSKLAPAIPVGLKEQLLTVRILVVGARFSDAAYAREHAEDGHLIVVVDRRRHIGGNAFDETLDDGTLVRPYGTHLLHTNYERVVEWLRQFGELVFCTHCVCALRPDSWPLLPLLINRRTFNEALP